jgi:hypothetical protein
MVPKSIVHLSLLVVAWSVASARCSTTPSHGTRGRIVVADRAQGGSAEDGNIASRSRQRHQGEGEGAISWRHPGREPHGLARPCGWHLGGWRQRKLY